MNFLNGLKKELDDTYNVSVTENGAVGFRTAGSALLDLNFAVASLRSATEAAIEDKFVKAFLEDKLYAIKWLFFARDVRGGLGERRLFRTVINAMAHEVPETLRPLIGLIPYYGRFDDLWCLLGTPVADTVVRLVQHQLYSDLDQMTHNNPISLLAKWMPSVNATSAQTRRYAAVLRKNLGMSEAAYRKTLSHLRQYLRIVERKMSSGEWNEIDYAQVPSRANLLYNKAFIKHDESRRRAFLEAVKTGEATIHAGTLYPHDIVHNYGVDRWGYRALDDTLEQLWKALPDTVQGGGNTIVVADGSGSMTTSVGNTGVSALEVANALAIYFAERSTGEFHDKYITFSERPQLVDLSPGKTLLKKLLIALSHNECANTNVEAVFDLILTTAVNHHMSQEDMPRNILIISDMEFDSCAATNRVVQNRYGWKERVKPDAKLFDVIAKRYQDAGYQLPRLVFWNVNSRTGTIPVKENELGVALVSGFSVNIAKMVMSGKLNPLECLLEQLDTERYKPIEDALAGII